jgi:hypothetical protein
LVSGINRLKQVSKAGCRIDGPKAVKHATNSVRITVICRAKRGMGFAFHGTLTFLS